MTEKISELPILIIGAGIGGLMTAIALKKAGFPVRVFERAEEIKPLGAGLTLWPNAVRVFQALGMEGMLKDHGLPETAMGGFYTSTGKPLLLLPPEKVEHEMGAMTVAIHRAEIHAALLERVGEGTIELGARFVAFEQDREGVIAYFADGQRVRGRLLIGADGIHSRVRQQLFPQSKPMYAGYTAWRGIARAIDPQRIGELWGRGLRFGIVPLSEGRTYWFATRNVPENEEERPERRQQELLKLFQTWHPVTRSLIEATPAETILRNDIDDLKSLSHWTEGRVTLLGDAAHAMTPNMGQGACQAIEDALVLAQELSHMHSVPEALQMYEQKRRPHANMVAARSRQIGLIAQWENPLACLLRDRLIRYMSSHMVIRQLKPVAGHILAIDARVFA